MPAIFFALISYLGWGIGDIFGTITARKLGAYSNLFWLFILRSLIFALYIPFAINDLSHITPNLFLLNIFLGTLLVGGALAFYGGLRIGNASLVGTIVASFAAVTVVLSLIFLGEKINRDQLFAILVIFIGLILSTLNFKEISGSKFIDRGIVLAFIAMLLWGIYFTFIKIPVREIGWFWPNYISVLLFPGIFLIMKLRSIKLYRPTFKNTLLALIAGAILTGFGDFSFNFAISTGLTVIVAPIAGSYPTLFVVLAFLIFKDPITKQQVLGIITTLVGIVLLSIFSV